MSFFEKESCVLYDTVYGNTRNFARSNIKATKEEVYGRFKGFRIIFGSF